MQTQHFAECAKASVVAFDLVRLEVDAAHDGFASAIVAGDVKMNLLCRQLEEMETRIVVFSGLALAVSVEPIADVAQSDDPSAMLPQLASQAADVDIDDVGQRIGCDAPHRIQNTLAGKGAALV